MSETENNGVKVSDRRRFDRDGNMRDEAASAAAAAQASADGSEPQTTPSEPPQAPEPAAGREELERLTTELAAARKRVDELARGYQSLLSDREEFKARLSRERERLIDVERGKVALTLLEAIDELDLSLASAGDESPLARGVRLIRDGLLQKAQAMGIERLNLVGTKYDPNVAEAADMEMTADEEEDQTVTAEVRGGYKLNDRVIRPARVKVAKYVRPAQA